MCKPSGGTIFDGHCLDSSQAGTLNSFPDFEFVFEGSDGKDVNLFVPASSCTSTNIPDCLCPLLNDVLCVTVVVVVVVLLQT